MRKILAAIFTICLLSAAAIAASVSKVFTTHSQATNALRIHAGESLSYTITGTFVAQLVLEQTTDGINYRPTLPTITAAQSGSVFNESGGYVNYRIRCSTHTSGSITATLTENSDIIEEFKNNTGQVQLRINDDSVDITGPLSVGGSVSAASFVGDGSGLTGVSGGGGGVATSSNPTWTGLHYFSAPVNFSSAASSVFFGSSVTFNGGIFGSLLLADDVPLVLSGPAGNITSASSVTASAFFGDGSGLTGISAGVCQLGVGSDSVLCQGTGNSVADSFGSVGGGRNNAVNFIYGTISGGRDNTVNSSYATISGGYTNNSVGTYAFIGGGDFNTAAGTSDAVAGGSGNMSVSNHGFIGGGQNGSLNAAHATIGGGINNTVNGSYGVISGGSNNTVGGIQAAVCGGDSAQANGDGSFIGSGSGNITGGQYSVIGGGNSNESNGLSSFVGAGTNNMASGSYSAICGGELNSTISDQHSFIGGGSSNTAIGFYASILGGQNNFTGGDHASVWGGSGNSASGLRSAAWGTNASAAVDGALALADGSGGGVQVNTINSLGANFTGGYSFSMGVSTLQITAAGLDFKGDSGANGAITAYSSVTASAFFGDGSNLSGVQDMAHAGGFSSTLGAGTTFFAFVPTRNIVLKNITTTIITPGTGGSGDTYRCQDGNGNGVGVTVPAAAAAGTVETGVGNVSLSAGTTVYFLLYDSAASPTPTGNISCGFSAQ